MDIHEYQAKELLSGFGVTVPPGGVAYSPEQAVYVATELGGWHWAIKAQIHAGGRGKAGGVKLCRTYQEVAAAAKSMLGATLVTKQTGPRGKIVHRLYVEKAEPYVRALYLGFVLDRKAERIRVIASAEGGMEVEEIAATRPLAGGGRSGGGSAGVPGAGARVRARPQHQAGEPGGDHDPRLLSSLPRSRCHDGRDQSVGGDQGQPRARARCENVI
jgi:hypothetical protein